MIKIGKINVNMLFVSLMLEAIKVSGLYAFTWHQVLLPLIAMSWVIVVFAVIFGSFSLILFIFTGKNPKFKVNNPNNKPMKKVYFKIISMVIVSFLIVYFT